MNIMRKLLVGHSRGAAMGEDPPQSTQHTALGLMHLHKLFSELAHPAHPLTQVEQEQRLYNMLPLFCKVFGNCPSSDMVEKFSDILLFCQLVSRLMVSEIRRRASNQSTEAASCAIAKFLEISSTEEHSNGWMLLTSVNLLAAGDAPLVDIMTAASLPSTLVKCLYLFFDLPPIENPDDIDPECEFSPKERRILLQKVFVQVLVRLCSHSGPAEELSRKDDLSLLFSAITSWCPAHNTVWRKSAAEVLMTLSRHGLSHSVVSYIHNKACIALCVENMQRVQELSPLEIVEMFVTVFCFLKDSSEVSQIILDDFRTCQGYIFLSEFLLRLEQNTSEEAYEALRNIVLLIASLTSCGYIELKPSLASTGSLFQLPGFQIPHLSGASVRNLQAFQVVQSVFMKAQTPYLCGLLLDAVSAVYHSDKANYFILESQHTLSQFSEKIHTKPPEIQEKFFKLLEFIIFDLNFVPCKELISLSILLKTQNSTTCSILCLKSLLNILHSNAVFKDVFREVGLLEVLVTCLHRYAAILKEAFPDASDEKPANCEISEDQLTLGSLVMEALTALLNSNSQNASVFRESGGARCAHNMVPYHICRQAALGIVQQLVLSTSGDDDMGTLLGLMHTAPVLALDLKTHILKSLLYVLRESHRTRTVFRKVGGFVYVMSVLVSMEGCLAEPPKPPWHTVEKKEILILLRTLFHTLAMAMRYEPANARFFASEICHTSLTDTVRLLGCFSNNTILEDYSEKLPMLTDDHVFHLIFSMAKDTKIAVHSVPTPLISSCLIFRLLYDTATDAFDKPNIPSSITSQSTPLRRVHSGSDPSLPTPDSPPVSSPNRRSGFTMNFSPPTPDPIIVHPGVVVSMHHLLPSIGYEGDKKMALTLQMYLAEVLRSLVRSERNQQVMCESGLPGELLVHCHIALENENHTLHPSLQYILERLSAQSLEPKDLREFLRLGSPLCCTPFDEDSQDSYKKTRPANHRDGGPVPLTRVKTLVSMTTPRDCRLHGTSIMPPFVEFDMSYEGFSCLYLPSVAPQSVSAPAMVGVGMVSMASDASVIGGIGTGDRVFPSQTGLSYSTWICPEKFSDPHSDPHAIRLLTLVRNIQGKDEQLMCLSIQISSRDKALLISTTETLMHQSTGVDWEPEEREECCVRVWCPELLQEGQWHHLVIVLNRAVLKNSSVSVYVDGQHHNTQKLHYISQNPGGGAANLTVATSVFGFIGTPPQFRRQSRLLWKQGPCHLVEEILSPTAVAMLYQLGPCYTGSFQAPTLSGTDVHQPLLAEEKIVFGINAAAVSVMTLAKIRRVYSKADCRSIAKMLGMSSHENATPIHILHNSGGHLSGPARCLGGILVGYLGARTFVPHPVSLTIDNVGGTATLLGLVAMAKDVEGLYAAVKALVCVVKSNRAAQQEMDRMKRYQTLAMLFKKKRSLLNSHILHLTFSLVGTVDSGRENTSIPNVSAFEDLLCDLEVWQDSPGDLQKSLYEHFCELVAESSEHKTNLKVLRDLNMLTRLLQVLRQLQISSATCRILCRLLCILLQDTNRSGDIRCLGQFIASTIPVSSVKEKEIELKGNINDALFNSEKKEYVDAKLNQNILLRNHCLALLYSLFFKPGITNYQFCEVVVKCLGYDWVLLFLQEHLHQSTVIWGMKMLSLFLSHQHLLQLFRESSSNGGWLAETDAILNSRMDIVLGFNVTGSSPKSFGSLDVTEDHCHVPGFHHLQLLLVHHVEIPEVYYLLLSVLLGLIPSALPSKVKLTMDGVWSYLFGAPTGQTPNNQIIPRGEICHEAAVVTLNMIRTIIHVVGDQDEDVMEYSVTLLHFFISLYHNRSDFISVCMTQEVISALVATLFPPNQPTLEQENMINSPLDDYHCSGDQQFVFLQSKENTTYYERDSLPTHSARKFVMDFLRVIVVDSFSLAPSPKQAPVIDLLLEAIPIDASHNQQCEFQMDILSLVMDHLLAADVLLGEQAAMPIVGGGSYNNIVPNVFYFTSCLVDKLWQGVFAKDSHKVLDFIIKLIAQAKRKGSSVAYDSVFHSLNRTILYQLSRPMENVVDQMVVLEGLQKIAAHKNIIFSPANHENDFFCCLCYCLLQLTEDPSQNTNTSQHTTWHVPVNIREPGETKHRTSAEEAASLICNAAIRVWDELYSLRKQALEDLCKISLSSYATSQNSKVPTLDAVRSVLQDPLSKVWHNYLETERKQGYTKETWQFQTQFQSKLQKVTGGLSRLASRKMKKENPYRAQVCNISYKDLELHTSSRVSVVRDLVEFQSKQYQQSKQCLQKYVFNEWLQTEAELTRERALWGPPVGSRLDKWILDMTEGPCRMRKKMVKNELFYIHYPYRPEVEGGENRALKYKVATSFDSKEYYKRWRPENMVEQDTISVDASSLETLDIPVDIDPNEEREIGFQGLRTAGLLSKSPVNRSSDWDDDQDVSDAGTDSTADQEPKSNESSPDNQNILRLLEDGEKISHMFRCARIQGLDTCEGLLLFGKEHFYVVDGFTILKTREIKDIDSLPVNMHDPIIPNSTPVSKHQKRMCSKFSYDEIKDVHKRRYLLQPIALEVFSADGRNYLLAFPRKIRNKVYARFLATATAITDSAQESLAGQKRTANVESSANLLSSLIGDTSVTQRWVRGEISNFQYLMHLNTLAGRSYNDLMQYPVFPWILADYDAEELDLNDSSTFRDFTKPMGAQTPDRLNQFKKRFKEWDDPHGETPPYHYGTFYSSAMIVASYLVRMEPFTQHFLHLQGGHFDLADRMFHSIKDAWLSAAKHNMADVKELIPEFFYLPEFLLNSNHFDLGSKQNGVPLNDVVLPPWAKNDPREFIRVHRQALECDYVSAHLHEWIDLIFGYKQQGPAAVEAVNVFHHLFYEGNVDIYSIDDPLKKNATIGFINNFGQIPKQLFKKPHPSKKITNRTSIIDPGPIMPGLSYSLDKLFFHNLDNLEPSKHSVKDLKGPVGHIVHHEKSLLAVEQHKVLVPPHYSRYVAWGFADHSIRIGPYEMERALFVWEDTPAGEILCCAAPNDKIIITAGTNSMVTVWQYDKKKLTIKKNLYGHTEPVTCLAASRAYNLIVSGSRDRTCILWDLSRLQFVRQLLGHPAPVAAVAINEVTGDIATCAGTHLYLWSINGDEIASVNTATGRADRTQQILCVAFSYLNEWDNQNVIMTGSSDGVVRMWSADYVQIPENTCLSTEEKESEILPDESQASSTSAPVENPVENKAAEIVRRMSLAGSKDIGELMQRSTLCATDHESRFTKSASGSSLSEEDREGDEEEEEEEEKEDKKEKDDDKVQSPVNNKGISKDSLIPTQIQHSKTVVGFHSSDISTKNSSNKGKSKKLVHSDNFECSDDPPGNFQRCSTVGPEVTVQSEDSENSSSKMRLSKSDTSLTDSFVMISENEALEGERMLDGSVIRSKKKKKILKDGFKWHCQLVFRSKLTMHTAFDRSDNTEPAAVTALAVSRDHKTVYVGDARGRVFSWSVTDKPGRGIADHWVRDEGGENCTACGVKFSFAERRHHCRNCGQLFCSRCSRFESEISRLRILKPVRVCQGCYNLLKPQQETGSSAS